MIDHVDRAISLNNLGMATNHRGDFAKALKYFESALAEMKQASGDKVNSPHYLDFLKIKDGLGYTYRELGNLDKALEHCKAATEAAEKRYGKTYAEMGFFYNNLGDVYKQKNNLDLAESCYQKALAVNRLHLPHDHPDFARDLYNLASILDKRGDYSGARKLLEEAMAIEEKVLGLEHPTLIATYEALGLALTGERDLSAARQYYQKAYDLAQTRNHPETAKLRDILAKFTNPEPTQFDWSSRTQIMFSDSVDVRGKGKVLLATGTVLALMEFVKAHSLNEAEQVIKRHPELLEPIMDTKMLQLGQEQVEPLAKLRVKELHGLLIRDSKKGKDKGLKHMPTENTIENNEISSSTLVFLQKYAKAITNNKIHEAMKLGKTHPEINMILKSISEHPQNWKVILQNTDPELEVLVQFSADLFNTGYLDLNEIPVERQKPNYMVRVSAFIGGALWICTEIFQRFSFQGIQFGDYIFLSWLMFSISWISIYWLLRKQLGNFVKLTFITISIALLEMSYIFFDTAASLPTHESALQISIYIIAVGFLISSPGFAIARIGRAPSLISIALIIMALSRVPFILDVHNGRSIESPHFISDILFGLGWLTIAWAFSKR